jgi:hypothetical protein
VGVLSRQKIEIKNLQLRAIYRQNFIAAPLIVLLLRFQTFFKGDLT